MQELESRPEARNLVVIYGALTEQSTDAVLAEFSGKGFGVFKPALVEVAVEHLAPVTRAMRAYRNDESHVLAVLDDGVRRAHAIAQPIMAEVRARLGFLGDSLG